MVRLVQETRAALSFEIIKHVGKGSLLQYILPDDKGVGIDRAIRQAYPQPVRTGCGSCAKIYGPEQPMFPFIHRPAEHGFPLVNGLACCLIDQLKSRDGWPAVRYDDCPLGLAVFITDL